MVDRKKLEEMDDFYNLPEMKIIEKIQNADDDVEKVLILRDIFESNCVNAKEYYYKQKETGRTFGI